MINSRKIEDLHPVVADKVRKFKSECERLGIDLLITSTFRDNKSQEELYAQGRTKPGDVVTNAKPGQSFHNWKVAVDVVPLRNGKPVWGTTTPTDKELWERVGKIGESVGLEWAGRWKKFKETAHFQYTGGLTLHDFQNGKTLTV